MQMALKTFVGVIYKKKKETLQSISSDTGIKCDTCDEGSSTVVKGRLSMCHLWHSFDTASRAVSN